MHIIDGREYWVLPNGNVYEYNSLTDGPGDFVGRLSEDGASMYADAEEVAPPVAPVAPAAPIAEATDARIAALEAKNAALTAALLASADAHEETIAALRAALRAIA
jgi:hypothetical protein